MVNFACAFLNLTSAVGTLQSKIGKQISAARMDSTLAFDPNASLHKQKTNGAGDKCERYCMLVKQLGAVGGENEAVLCSSDNLLPPHSNIQFVLCRKTLSSWLN